MFSDRVPRSLEPNRITKAVRHAREIRRLFIDLTVTNPTTAGIDYPSGILGALASPGALRYDPEAFGLLSARRAVAADYDRRGISIDAERIVLTSSTSEAYSLLFKLLCDSHGSAVLIPVPSYPLFDHLTRFDGVTGIPYRLEYHGRWSVALEDVERAWTSEVRAAVAVSPNNPTGSILSRAEIDALSARCAERNAALILDEVFADYPLARSASPPAISFRARRPDSAVPPCLAFRLGGLSKSAGLPQVKLGWIAVEGPDALVREALDRLEVICDAYLSVSTPVQVAAPALVEAGASIRRQILERITLNECALRSAAASHPAIQVLATEGGWSSVLRIPSTRTEEDFVVDLLEQEGVLVHPGFFFDFPHEAFVVVSLLPEPQTFMEGVSRLLEVADA
jgi:alanine-synthesizing transaminase